MVILRFSAFTRPGLLARPESKNTIHRRRIVYQEFIEVRGARENNLKDISLNIPKRKITVFTGVSGSGKSSLGFDTVAAEAQRQLNDTFTAFVRGFLPHYGQPDVDGVEHLNAPIIIDQKRVGGGSRSTVGTYTDIAALLRLLFSRAGQPHVGPAYAFSFNPRMGCARSARASARPSN
jgi:excinuclease UvrABC ATPase subunit